MTAALATHPAKFSDPILDVLSGMVRREVDLLGRRPLLLDPFAGTGKIHQLEDVADTRGVELRPRWAACHPRTLVGDATRLHWRWTDRFDVVATSCCYGNRFADHHDAKERCSACAGLGVCGNGTDDPTPCEKCGGAGTRDWTRHSYAHDYGEPFEHPSDAGVMHFGRDGAYETLHERAWRQARRVLRPDDSPEGPGLFLLNVSNFVRKHEEVDVIGWHRETLRGLGFVLVGEVPVETRRMGFGANRSARTAHEVVLALRAPTAGTRRRSALR